MTQEEKAKAYNEALERARKIHSKIVNEELLGFPGQIEDIFPELRKEEKPLTPFQQCLNCILRGVYYAEVSDEKVNEFILNVVRTRTDELIKLAKRHEYADCQLRESEDEKIINQIISLIKEVQEDEDWHIGARSDDAIMWLEKQKEQDWNKKPCLTCQEYEKGHKQGYTEGCTAGYNKAMKEQKPAEWSEEDEERCMELVSLLKDAEGYLKEHGNMFSYNPMLLRNWLKSLRPSWRPSEEQMEALNALNLYGDLSYVGQQNQLISLYQDLKKLM